MAKPKLALIPSGYSDGRVYSVLPTSGSGDFTFSRDSKATRINKDGLIENVDENISRLNYSMIDGKVVGCPSLLLEPQRINSLPYSEDFSNADWTKFNSTAIANSIISPDGSLSATKLTEDTSNSTHRIYDTIVVSSSGVTYTQSIFAKSGGNGRYLRIFRGSGTYNFAVFDLDNGTVFSKGGSNIISTKIEKYPNGWYKCSSTFTTQFTNIATYYGIQNGNLDSYQGDETSSIYLWGAQLEQGSYPTSYIPTNGTAVTRLAETANGAGNADTFNDSEGVLMVEVSSLANDGTSKRIGISDGSTSNRVSLEFDEIANTLKVFVSSGGVGNGTLTYVANNLTDFNKIAISYKLNDLKMIFNGFLVDIDTSVTAPIGLNDLSFDSGTGGLDFYGNTKQLQYHNSALTDSELEQLTSWDSFIDMATSQLYTIQ